jgi:hypothetical protein
MAGYTIPFALPRQPRTPRYRPRRDFVVTAGDDVTLELTIYQDDMGGGPVDVTGAEATWTIWQDGSTALVEVTGDIEDAPAGRIDVVIAAAATTDIPGRYSHTLRIEFPNGMTTVVTGMIHIQPVYGTGTGGGDPGTMTPAEGIYGDVIIGELTAASAIISGALDVHGLVTLHNDATNALTVAGGAVFGPSDFRQVEILPTTTADGPTGMPQAFLVRRVGSDDTVGAAGNLWVSQSSWVLTDTSAPAGVRYNSLVSTASGAGVDPGEVWGFTSILSTQASTDSLNAVPIYGQGVRRGLPSSGVGVPIFGGVLEARSLTGASSATDGRMRSLELDIFANGADDISPAPGREALTFVLDKNDAGGAAPHVTSVIGVYTSTGATCSWVLRPNLTWTEAFLDARGGTQGGSAHTLWMNAGQTIALDASAATKIGSNGSTITATGNVTVDGALVSDIMRAEAGSVELTGTYSKTTAPFDVRLALIRTAGSISAAPRDVMRAEITSDRHNTRNASTGASAAVTMKSDIYTLGVTSAPIADSWDGSRVVRRFSIVDRNAPASSLVAPTGVASQALPEINVTWSGATLLNTRGGTAPELGYAVGRTFLDYGSILQRSPSVDGAHSGAQNLQRSHLYEGGLFFFQKSSVQSAGGIGLNVAANRGVSPVYEFTAFTTSKSNTAALGFRMGFGSSGWALHGMDPLRGVFAGVLANRNDPLPRMLTGLHLSDMSFSGPAIRWPGGDFAGGEHDTAGTGRLRIGTGYLASTTSGASLRASGYVGRAAGYVFTRGTDLTAVDLKITIRPSMIAEDAYGGVYRLYGLDIANNEFTRAEALTAPVYDGASPPATLEIALRDTSGGVTEWEVTEAGTTTVHPTQLTAKIADYYVGRTLTYLSGPAAGEEQTITAYNETTGELTTAAFSTNPTENISLVVNYNFASAFPTAEDTILNGWQYTLNGGTGTAVKVITPIVNIQLNGDGTNAAAIDQQVTFGSANDGLSVVWGYGSYRIKIGSTRGGSDYVDRTIIAAPPDPGADPVYVSNTTAFFATSTTVWIRVENVSAEAAGIRMVRIAEGETILPAIRAAIITPKLEVTQSWTQRNTLALQDDGGPLTVGGTLGVAGNFAVATSKFTADATTGNTVAAGTSTAGSFVPTSATVPINGMFLPATNTLGWAVASVSKLQMDGTALFVTTNDSLALGKLTQSFADLFLASGGVINWNNSNIRLAHAAGSLSLLGGEFLIGNSASTSSAIRLNAASGTARNFFVQTASVNRWLHAYSVSETGSNIGSSWAVTPYTDAGVQRAVMLDARRGSGLFGGGEGYYAKFAPMVQSTARATYPAGVIGNERDWGDTSDAQPSTTLGANPISVTAGSPTVTITWTGACVTTGPIGSGTYEVWVNLTGVTAVGGITPTGWLQVQSRPTADTFTVTWTSNASSTATGGGSSVVVTPSFSTAHDKIYSVATSPADGYSVQRMSLYAANPTVFKTSNGPSYQQNWSVYNSAVTADTSTAYTSTFHEIDLVNRGPDEGYGPDLYQSPRASKGFWAGAYANVFSWVPGGGTAKNWNTVYSIYSQGGLVGNYTGYSVQPLALASSASDPSGQGGTGIDIFGNAIYLFANGFTTSIGTATVSVHAWVYGMQTMVNGDTIYIPKSYTISGVTFGNASYTVANVNLSAGTFDITGTGSAAASISGGGTGQYILFEKHTPQSPFQIWGGFEHGIRTKFAKFNSGYLIDTQPGAGIRWDNGTATATITATGTGSNVDLILTTSGTGRLNFGTHTGSGDAAISGYIEIKDAGGTTRKLAVIT